MSGGGGKGTSGGGTPWGALGALGLGLGQSWAQNPNIGFGGSNEHSDLSNMDPLGNAITKIGGDPLNLYGNKNNPNALLFPNANQNSSGQNALPSVLPNLGAQSMIPQMPQGSFMPLGQTNPMGGNGGGIFNQMAAQSAGQLFNPQNPKGAMNAPIQSIGQSVSPGIMPMGAGNHPLFSGGNYGRGFQQR